MRLNTHSQIKPDSYTPACAVCLAECHGYVCHTCDDAAMLTTSESTGMLTTRLPKTSMNSVYGGKYSSNTNISSVLCDVNVGVIDLDNDEEHGGGAAADMTANSTFNFCIALVPSDIIVGAISHQKCNEGSVICLREDANDSSKPMAIITQSYPNGKPDLPRVHT